VRRALFLLVALAALALPACGGDDESSSGSDRVTVYSGREEKLVGGLFEQFEKDTGVKVEVRYGDSAELAATLSEEGDNSPSDVFFSQDAGALGAVAERGLFSTLPKSLSDRVDERFRDEKGRWVGVSGRARVLAYNPELIKKEELPASVFDLTDSRWKGKLGFPPTNASFQAFVSAMRLEVGDDRTREWLEGIKKNDPKFYESNDLTATAIAKGELTVGLVNHYYKYEVEEELGDVPLEVHFFKSGDPGSLVNAAGIGLLEAGDHGEAARRLADYLLSVPAQRYFAEKTAEYPLAADVHPRPDLRPLDSIHGPAGVKLGQLGPELPSTLKMIEEAGLTN
jgi:iron(III) transport system substrate-binding protein